ncbi:MAG: hypothetical protein ACJAS3_001783 [Roseivirga sp.]|jgi:hypothetical protein
MTDWGRFMRKHEARLHYQLAFSQDSKMDIAKEG